MTTHDTRTVSETAIPADVMLTAMKVANTVLRNLDQDDVTYEVKAIARAIMAERERCAEIASGMSSDLRNRDGARFTASKIAAAIRTPTAGASHD